MHDQQEIRDSNVAATAPAPAGAAPPATEAPPPAAEAPPPADFVIAVPTSQERLATAASAPSASAADKSGAGFNDTFESMKAASSALATVDDYGGFPAVGTYGGDGGDGRDGGNDDGDGGEDGGSLQRQEHLHYLTVANAVRVLQDSNEATVPHVRAPGGGRGGRSGSKSGKL